MASGIAGIQSSGVPSNTGPTSPLAGDVNGLSTANVVVKIQHNAVDPSALGLGDAGKALVWNGTEWVASVITPPAEQVYACPSGLAVGDGVYISGDFAVDKCDPSDLAKMPAVGFVRTKPSSTTCTVQKKDELTAFVGLVAGTRYWFDPNVPGGITATPPPGPAQVEQQAGIAASSTTLIIQLGAPPLQQL